MNEQQKPVNITILDKEYNVACTEQEREDLYSSAKYLNDKMTEVRNLGNVVGSERIAVMAALNIVHEFLKFKENTDGVSDSVQAVLNRVQDKISNALGSESVISTDKKTPGSQQSDLKQA